MIRPYYYLALAALAVFLLLAVDAAFADTAPGDVWLTHRLQSVDSGALSRVLDATESFAAMPLLIVVAVVAGGLFIYLGGTPAAAVVVAAVPSRLLVSLLKELFERPRPTADQVEIGRQPDSFSFPSGHAFNAIVLYGLIFCLAAVYIPQRPLRWALQTTCAYVILAVSLERVYHGNHWTSDVFAGLALGALVLAGLLWLHERLGGLRSRRARR